MSTNPKSKVIVGCLTVVLGGIGVFFQNFTPHRSLTDSDVSDIYMNSALSTALKTKAAKNKSNEVAFNNESAEDDPINHKRVPTSDESQESVSEDANSTSDANEH